MVSYTVRSRHENSATHTSIHVEGLVASDDWEKLRILCLDTLKNSDQIVLDIDRVSNHDAPLRTFLSILRETAQLLGKRVTVSRKLDGPFIRLHEAMRDLGIEQCQLPSTDSCFFCDKFSACLLFDEQ